MYLGVTEGIEVSDKTQYLRYGKYEIYWEGFVFAEGARSGETAIRFFAKELGQSDLGQASAVLSGSFVCFVQDNESDASYAFTDGARRKPLYYTENAVCSSFLELAKRSHLRGADMDPFCLVEFIYTGLQFSRKIFFDQINILDAHEILKITPGISIALEHRAVRDPFQEELPSNPVIAFLDAMEKTVELLRKSGLRVSVDLTGGLDTRLLVAMLDYFGLEFETAVSGTPDHPDVQISKKVARARGNSHDHHPIYHEVRPTFLWSELGRVVKAADGMNGSHRLYQLALDRKERGIELTIGGNGGQFYKDGVQWITAFLTRPGIKAKERLLSKFVHSGMASWSWKQEIPHNIFCRRLREVSKVYKVYIHNQLKEKCFSLSASKHELADRIFYQYSLRDPRSSIINHYSPYLDPDCIAIGVNLLKRDRFRHRFHRKVISRLNPQLANLSTARIGMSMAKGSVGIMRDIFGVIYWRMSMANKRYGSLDNPELYSCLRRLPEAKNALAGLKDYDIVEASITLEEISNIHLGRLVNLFMVLQILE